MKAMYYPSGQCYRLTPEMITKYNDPTNLNRITLDRDSPDQNTLYLEVKLIKTDRYIDRDFSLVSFKNEDLIRQFTNDFNLRP